VKGDEVSRSEHSNRLHFTDLMLDVGVNSIVLTCHVLTLLFNSEQSNFRVQGSEVTKLLSNNSKRQTQSDKKKSQVINPTPSFISVCKYTTPHV